MDEEYYKLQIQRLEEENENLRSKIIDITMDLNYSKEKEMLEFLRDLYKASKSPYSKKISKQLILKNLKESLEEFAKNNRIQI